MIDHLEFRERLLAWWYKNRRQFPWRQTQDPYHILISEVLLHRTRADQVIPVYTEFLKRFPYVEKLACAAEEQIERVLYPLGLHWRSRLVRSMAQQIVSRYHGRIIADVQELKTLPGVGDYIASAVVSFAFGHPEVLLDTNTVRVLGRILGMKITDASRRKRYMRTVYRSILDEQHPREFNYAMIDLGALICRPQNPRCQECPLMQMCIHGSSRAGDKY